MNKVFLIGNLSKDPEAKQTKSGHSVASFTVAVNRRKSKDGTQEADFINCVAWNQLADLVSKYLKKGRKVCVVGQIQTRSYESQDGSKRYATEVIADEVEFLSAASEGTKGVPAQMKNEQAAEMMPVDEDDLPF